MQTIVQATIFIARPPEAVTAVMLDPAQMVHWTSDLERFEVVEGQGGEAGAVARLHYVQGGNRYVMQDELLSVEPNRRYVSRVSGDALTAQVETTLVPTDGGTQMTIRWSGSGKTLLVRIMLPFMRRRIAGQALADLTKLKHLVEGLPPAM
jgi:uncharacterized protein YndB with AHSA1/START domain